MGMPRQYNAVTDMVDRNVEQGYGEKTAFIDPERVLTYSQLQIKSKRMGNLLTNLDISQESRVALLLHDTVDYPAAFWGAIRAGVVPVCLNTLLTTAQYKYILVDSRVQALFVSANLLNTVEPLFEELPFLRHVIVVGGEKVEYAIFHELLDISSAEFDTVQTCADEAAFWLYSSGSTGDPKGVRHIHSSQIYVAENYGKNIIGICHDDVCFSAAKLFFAYGLGAGMAIPMSVGATTILLPGRPTPDSVMKILKEYRPTLFFGVPTLYAAMLADENCNAKNGSDQLRLCVSAGEALPKDVGLTWRDRMGVDIIDGIGSTEMLHVFLSNRPGDIRYGTSGKEIPGYRLRLVDEEGNDVADGDLGELLVSGESAGDGYWNQRTKSRATFAGEWTHTGDKYTKDEDGYYHYCGRTDDMFKVSGRWVSPFEVEQALTSHPAVMESAVIGEEDAEGLVKPKAFVVLNSQEQQRGLFDELKQHVKTSVGPWKYPRWIVFVEDLPKTATGKIQRYKLRST